MRLALDTNRYADLCRGNPRAVELVEAADAIWLPFVVVGELRAGFAVGSQGPRQRSGAATVSLETWGGHPLRRRTDNLPHYASVYRQLRKQGTPIPTNDMWIAALVLQHSLTLYDRDRHFDRATDSGGATPRHA